ncbi:MAG: cation:proton antiporter [Caldilineales bacterium]|nr:cation:proton antiporter [Caldilineales bacterium]
MYTITVIVLFALLALAARDIGQYVTRIGLPMISGFLLLGMLVGPYVLGTIDSHAREQIAFINAVALGFIGVAAGGELNLAELKGHLRSIMSIIGGQILFVYLFGIVAYVLLADQITFMQGMTQVEIFAVAILGATIMIARSPASAYAIIKELRASGPFTSRVLGATVLKDSVVILIFATAVSVAVALIEGVGIDAMLLGLIAVEIVLDILMGLVFGLLLRGLLALSINIHVQGLLLLLAGYSIFWLAGLLESVHLGPFSLFTEPLLICLTAGFYVANFTAYRAHLQKIIENLSLPVFVMFFMLVGIDMNLDVLRGSWFVIVALWAARAIGVYIGSFTGGVAAHDPMRFNSLSGLTFLTQAGVSVGLAQEVAHDFAGWGQDFATLAIAVIVVNQIVGPPLFKIAIRRVGEAHTQAVPGEFDGELDVVLFGVDARERMLARRFQQHGWNVKMVRLADSALPEDLATFDNDIRSIDLLSREALSRLDLARADAVVAMLPTDDLNFQLCELIYENFGIKKVVALVTEINNVARFREIDVFVVQASTAVVSLLETAVRTPTSASILIGDLPGQEIRELIVRDAEMTGRALREIAMPSDVLVLSIHRDSETIVPHGYSRLKVGDAVNVWGSIESLDILQIRFSGVQIANPALSDML